MTPPIVAPTTDAPLAVTLSREELFFLMGLLKADAMPGVDLTWAGSLPSGTPPPEIAAALEGAAAALEARGYLIPTTEGERVRVDIPAMLVMLVGICAFSEYTLFVAVRGPEGEARAYFHEARGVVIAHTSPLPRLHTFTAMVGRPGMVRALAALLHLQSQRAQPQFTGEVVTTALEAARAAAMAGDASAATQLLLRGGLAAPTAAALCAVLAAQPTLAAVGLAWQDAAAHHQELDGAIVTTTEQCFLLRERDATITTVAAVAAAEVLLWLQEHLPPPRSA